MSSILSIALSGLRAATKRIGVSASNVANASVSRPASDPDGVFKALRVVAQSAGGGGVVTRVVEKSPATVSGPDLSGDLAIFPNVSLVEEAVEQKLALASYRANAAVIRVQQELDDALLDVEV